MSKFIATAAILAILVTAASAQTAAPAAKKIPDGCTLTTITQPVVSKKHPDHPFTFRGLGSDVKSIELCNPPGSTDVVGVTPSPTAGARVIVRFNKDGAGTLALPSNFSEGNVSNIYVDVIGDKLFCELFRTEWAGGVKSKLALENKTAEYPGTIDLAKCEAALPPARKAELKKP